MSEIICKKCEMRVAEFQEGELTIFCCSELREAAKRISFEQILAAAVSDERGLEILLKFCIENPNVKFL